jgi:hypothetical protein
VVHETGDRTVDDAVRRLLDGKRLDSFDRCLAAFEAAAEADPA